MTQQSCAIDRCGLFIWLEPSFTHGVAEARPVLRPMVLFDASYMLQAKATKRSSAIERRSPPNLIEYVMLLHPLTTHRAVTTRAAIARAVSLRIPIRIEPRRIEPQQLPGSHHVLRQRGRDVDPRLSPDRMRNDEPPGVQVQFHLDAAVGERRVALVLVVADDG